MDQEEELYVISSYKKCLADRFKANDSQVVAQKLLLQDKLLKELTIRFVTEYEGMTRSSIHDMLVYDVCGYLMRTRSHLINNCEICKKSMVSSELELPEDFDAAFYTSLRNKGGLIFVTIAMGQGWVAAYV